MTAHHLTAALVSKKQNYIEINGDKAYVGQLERRAFCPGEFDELKESAPEFETMVKAIWTPEVITAWLQKQTDLTTQAPAS